MSEEKAFDIKRFAEELEALPDSAFSKPDEHEKNPYRMAEEVANGNPLRMRKCLELISEILLTIDVEAWENCSAMFSGIPCRGDAVVRLIEDSLWLTFGGVQLRCLQCGMGKRTFQRIAKTIDLHGATPHIFRHSFLTYAQTVVTDIKTLQAIAGHADIQTTMNRYVHQQSDRIVETGKRVTDLFVQKMCKQRSPESLENTGVAAS